MNTIVNLPPAVLGIVIFGIVLLMALIRYLESQHLSRKYPEDQIILASFGVTWFGQESKLEKPIRKTGAIALVRDGVYYHSRFGGLEAFIPKNSIKTIGTTDFFCDKPLNDTVIQISFKNEKGDLDRMAFRIPSPAKWILMLQKTLLNK
ncbi:MAG: hypothetical protein PQJ61_09900 [Spirochaetales bacterium]|uniref:Uncharacterized protein n=1 Tax=Candidatus Thalassospirochaeta sargassi TaxID=3119039 RepID=A0AAJ1IIZ2_9SPIO|nr:hypothetical protein [Spirochaetales bacterium]